MNHVPTTEKKSKKIEAKAEEPTESLRERAEHVRDIVENVRDKAEVAFRDRPYLVPVAAGAVGFGVGLLFGSKITRFILFAAVGTVVSDTLGGEIKRLAGDFIGEFKKQLTEGDEKSDEGESSSAAV